MLAQELGLTNNYWYSASNSNRVLYNNLSASSTNWSYSSNNRSYYGHNSSLLVTELNNFTAPPDASNALFVVWVNDADFVNDMSDVYPSTNIALWSAANNQSLTNHYNIITNLYAKGVRTLLMPNAVDITEVPAYDDIQVNSPNVRNFIRHQVIRYDTAFAAMLSNAMVSCPGLKIYKPDFFSLLDDILAHPAAYGVTNALYGGVSEDAYDDPALSKTLAVDGPGSNYVFWDKTDPTAKVQAIMADLAKQLIAPAGISQITALGGTNRLTLTDVPVGLDGIVESSTNLALTNWTTVADFDSTNSTQTVFVPASGPRQFYRLKFPFSWSWP